MDKKRASLWLMVVSILGLLISLFLLYQHYSPEESTFCNFGASFNCDIVNKGEYSNVDGVFNLMLRMMFGGYYYFDIPIPNSLISVIVFIFIIGAAIKIRNNKNYFGMNQKTIISVLKVLMILSILYALFLVYIEYAILQFWCIFCLALDAVIILSTWLIFVIGGKKK